MCVAWMLGAAAVAQTTRPADALSPYDAMRQSFGSYLDPADANAWPAKVRAIRRDEYHFWRGTRDLFYDWCRTHCVDWSAQRDAVVVSQGDLHFGNMGVYAVGPGKVAAGLVDFDESARLPFQVELLQGMITLDLVARPHHLDAAPARAAMVAAYAAALASDPTATAALAGDPVIARLTHNAEAERYSDELNEYCDGTHFRGEVRNKKGKVVDQLTPVPAAQWPDFAKGLAAAIASDPRLTALTDLRTPEAITAAVQDIARRSRADSSGSQGLAKYLVRLHRPFNNSPDDALLYLKQEIPSAAERVGFVPMDARPPGQRYVADQTALCDPPPWTGGWCAIGNRSFWVSVHEPWGKELEADDVVDADALEHLARLWGTLAGSAHRADAVRLRSLLTNALVAEIGRRADAYGQVQDAAYAAFVADPRTASRP